MIPSIPGAFFHPEMSHQIFGEQENIFGYKNLKVEARFSAATLKLWLNVNSDGNVKVRIKYWLQFELLIQ